MQTPGIFEPVRLGWQGREIVIQPDNIMPLLAKIEDTITMADLYRYASSGRVPVAKLSIAYGAILRHGGVYVTDAEVYAAMFKGATQKNVQDAVQMLLMLMVPPQAMVEKHEGKATPRRRTAGTSKRRTKQQS